MLTTIRRMTAGDYAAARRLWRESGLSDEPEDSREDVTRLLAQAQSAGFVAVASDGAVCGVVLCGTDGRYGYIHHLAVAEAARGCSAGRELVAACTGFLQCRHVITMVRDTNDAARGFWARVGYREAEGLRICYRRTDAP
jgi:ribosomal protein S18 acetylase RimI-like enzyme